MANPELPWFRFFARDWLADSRVTAMPLEAQGAYLRLLCHQWEDGGLPHKPAQIARLLGVTESHIVNCLWEHLGPHFPPAGEAILGRGRQLKNPRLHKEREAALRLMDNLTERGRKAANVRWHKPIKSKEVKCTSNANAMLGDAHPHPHPDEEEEMSLAAGNGGAPPKEIIERWNELAEKYNLTKVRKLSPARLASARRRLGEVTGLWDELEEAIAQRGSWARSRRFPSFDQAMRPTTLMKLLEGNYAARPGEEQDDERSGLIKRLQGFAGTAWKSGTLISTGISYMHSDAPWSDLLTTQLQEIIGDLERR